MSANTAGDLDIFISGLIANVITGIVCIGIFMYLRVSYPMVYSNNVLKGFAPSKPDLENKWSWYSDPPPYPILQTDLLVLAPLS